MITTGASCLNFVRNPESKVAALKGKKQSHKKNKHKLKNKQFSNHIKHVIYSHYKHKSFKDLLEIANGCETKSVTPEIADIIRDQVIRPVVEKTIYKKKVSEETIREESSSCTGGDNKDEGLVNHIMYSLYYLNTDPSRHDALREAPKLVEESKNLYAARIQIGRREEINPKIMNWDQFCRHRATVFISKCKETEDTQKIEDEKYIFSLSPEGNIYLAKDDGNVKHIDLDAGRPSLLAGEMIFTTDEKDPEKKQRLNIIPGELNQKSGHYRHNKAALSAGCRMLLKRGIIDNATAIHAKFIKRDYETGKVSSKDNKEYTVDEILGDMEPCKK